MGHEWYKCSKRVCSICRETGHDPITCPNVVEKNANLVLSEIDKLDGICEDAQCEYVLDTFFSASTGEYDFRLRDNKGVWLSGWGARVVDF